MEKIIIHPVIGEVTLRKRRGNTTIRLSVRSTRGVLITIPWYSTYNQAIKFLNSNVEWVVAAQNRQKLKKELITNDGKLIPSPRTIAELELLRQRARKELVPRLELLASQNGFTEKVPLFHALEKPLYNSVTIKNNVSNWGSCSGKNNINLNMKLVYLPQHLQDYVMLHELCHLHHHNHSPQFHALLNSLLQGRERMLRSELRTWRLAP